MPTAPGTRLGPYEIVAPLGAGGMGEVYRARDPRLGRDVAIKILPASLSQDPERLRRFEQEARAAGQLNHPNITAVHDIGADAGGGSPYPVAGGEPREVPGGVPGDFVVRWSPDARSLLILARSVVPARLERLDVATGKRETFCTVGPADLTAVTAIFPLIIGVDEKTYAYTCRRMISHLFLVDGAR
jgi:serine/threonine protein kinase